VLVKDLMAANPIHVGPDRSVADALQLMGKHGIRHLPVLDEAGKLLGLVTRASLNMALPGIGTGLTQFESRYLTSATLVREVMIGDPIQVAEDEAVEEAARVMNVNRISSLLVMRAGKIVGIITDTDIFEAMLELLGARRPGVRLTAALPNRPGELSKLSGTIGTLGGNIMAVGGWHLPDDSWAAVIKIDKLSREQILAAVAELPGVKVLDIREQVAPESSETLT